jgi:hypothetical protein
MNKINQTKGETLIKVIIALLFIGISGVVVFLITKIAKQSNNITNPNIVSEITTTSQTIMPNIDLQNKIIENWSTSEKVIMLQSFQPEVLPANYSGKFIHSIAVSPDYKKILYIADDVKLGYGNIGKLVFQNVEKNIKEEISLPLSKLNYRAGENQFFQHNDFFFTTGEFNNNSNFALFLFRIRDKGNSLLIIDTNTGKYNIENNIINVFNAGFFPDGTIYYFQKDTDRIKGYFGGKSITLPVDITENLYCQLKDNFLFCTTQKEESKSYLASVFVLNKEGKVLYKTLITEPIKYDSIGGKTNFWLRPLAYNEKNNQLIYTRNQNAEDLLYQNDRLITLPINYKLIDSATFDNEGVLWIIAREERSSDTYFVIKDGKVINKLIGLSNLFISDDKSQIAYRGTEMKDNQKYESVFVNGQKVFSRAGNCLNRSLPCEGCCERGLSISPDNKSVAIILDSKTKKGYFSLRINQANVEDLELEDIIGDLIWLNNKTVAVIEGLDKNIIQGEDMIQTITYGKKRIHLINIKGKLIWSSPLLDDIFSKPILIDNKVIFIGQEGKEIVQKVYELVN